MSPEAVRNANAAFYDAFSRLDLDRMSNLWARSVDVTCVHPGWDLVVGYDAVMQSWRMIFEGSGEIRMRIDEPHLTSGPTMAYVVCREILFTTVQGMPVENVLTAINTFVFEAGEWRIAHHHAAPILAGRPKISPARDTTLH